MGSDHRWLELIFTAELIDLEKLLDEEVGVEKFSNKVHKELPDELKRRLKQDDKYRGIVKYLQEIASLLEKEKTLTWAKLNNFRNRREIIDIVKKAKEKYAEIKKLEPKIQQEE